MTSIMDEAQSLQGLTYKVCSTTSPEFVVFGSFILVFGISAIMHQRLVAVKEDT